jgi:AcrR family transcriptional regulator
MARPIPPERFGQLIEAATKTFVTRGYRLTQMADIAEALGVAKGTLYGYVESKEALFDAAVRYADGHVPPPAPGALPLATPKHGATVAYIRERLATEASDMKLVQVCAGTLAIEGTQRELEQVLEDLYRRMARNRLAVKLVDRCAAEYPELAEVWFGQGRWAQHELLVQLIKSRAKKKHYRAIEQPEVVARAVLETLAFWAVHRHFDAAPQAIDDESAERAVIDLIAHGLLGGA